MFKYKLLNWVSREVAVMILAEEMSIINVNDDNSWILTTDNKIYDFLFKTLMDMKDMGIIIYDGRADNFMWNLKFKMNEAKDSFIDKDSDNLPF